VSGWPVVKLSDVATLSSGGTPSKSNPAFWNGDIPWVSPKDMKSNRIEDAEDRITRDAISESAARIVGPDSVLAVVRSGILAHTFPVATIARDISFNQDIKAITPKNGSLLPPYLFWMLKSREAQILRIGVKKGATVHSLSNGYLEALRFPLPRLDEQQRVVGLLNRAAEIRRRAGAARGKARAIIPALFLDTFGDPATNPKGWPTIEFEEAIDDVTRFVPKIMRRSYLATGKFPIYDQGQIEIPGFTDDVELTFSADRPLLLFGDHTRVFRIVSKRFARGADGVRLFRTKGQTEAYFLRTYLEQYGLPNAGYSRHYRFLKSVPVATPPLDLQATFAEQVQRLEALARHLDATAAKAEAMAAALSAEVFE